MTNFGDKVYKTTSVIGQGQNIIVSFICVGLGISFIYASYSMAYIDPIDNTKTTKNINFTFPVVGFFFGGLLTIYAGISTFIISTSPGADAYNTASFIGNTLNNRII